MERQRERGEGGESGGGGERDEGGGGGSINTPRITDSTQ